MISIYAIDLNVFLMVAIHPKYFKVSFMVAIHKIPKFITFCFMVSVYFKIK